MKNWMNRWTCINSDAGKCEQIRLLAFFLRRNIHRFLSRIFFLHVKNDDKNNNFLMLIIYRQGREEKYDEYE